MSFIFRFPGYVPPKHNGIKRTDGFGKSIANDRILF